MFEETVFYSETASGGLSTFNLIGIILLACLALILLIVVIIWLKKKLSRPELYGLTREEAAKRWQQIMATSKQNGNMGLKLAIIEADNLLDAGLKSLVMQGDTLGERLKFACYKFPKLKNVWWAHKLRNNLVHDHSFRLNAGQAKKALGEFEKALKELKVL